MQKVKIDAFQVIGITVRTTNEEDKSAQDIGNLWGKFLSEGIQAKIPNTIDQDILSIYTNYEGDHTQPYDAILACRVSSLENIPEGMIGRSFEGGAYEKFTTKGDLMKGLIVNEWTGIWEKGLDRTFTTDFEVFGEKAQNPNDAEVDIFVAIKD